MRKIILYIANSLDGYIAGKDDDLDWLFHDQDYGYNAFIERVDCLLMGRRSWEISKALGDWFFGERQGYVFSRTLKTIDDEHCVLVAQEVDKFMQDLRSKPGKDIWLMGGGGLVREFLQLGLIDEIILSIHPVLLGEGIPLFPSHFDTTKLVLTDSQAYDTGMVQLTYKRG